MLKGFWVNNFRFNQDNLKSDKDKCLTFPQLIDYESPLASKSGPAILGYVDGTHELDRGGTTTTGFGYYSPHLGSNSSLKREG